MASHKIFLLFFLTFLYSPTSEAQPTYLHHDCSVDKTFTTNSAFQSDRISLLSSLASGNTANTEFYNTTVTAGGDTVYGLFLCLAYIDLQECHQCVVDATQRLPSVCPSSKEAIIWYNQCMLRYSNRSIFSTVDTRPDIGFRNYANVSQQSYLEILLITLNVTADKAANASKKYATNEATISGFGTLYSLVQCTPDLSTQDCRRCLTDAIGYFQWCCAGKQGGRILFPSCYFRYEMYRFYNLDDQPGALTPTPAALSPPTNSSDPQGKVMFFLILH